MVKDYQIVSQEVNEMATTTDKFSTLYKIRITLSTTDPQGISNSLIVPTSDIISIAMIHNYDMATFPIIRIRLYSDLSTMEMLTQYPDRINVAYNMTGAIYRMNDEDNKSPTPVGGSSSLSFSLKGYIENKNIPVSIMDQYDHGIKKSSDLNTDRKVPIEIYCYDDSLIHYMRKKAPSIFKSMSLSSIIETAFRNQGTVRLSMDPIHNQEKYDQVLVPNLNINEMLSYFDSRYGLYPKGAQVYGDIDQMYICDSSVENGTKPLPIHVESYKSSSDMGGMRRYGNIYQMNTKAENVSVISETDIEKVLNAENIMSINVNTMDVDAVSMVKLYPDIDKEKTNRIRSSGNNKYMKILRDKIESPDILHKTESRYVAETFNARMSERITKVDISGVGFDIGKLNIRTRYNLIFDSPIRGMSINQLYRATTMTHVISNLDSNLFIAQTTMNLCSN